jgi:nitrous oxidase accessory protein NosD
MRIPLLALAGAIVASATPAHAAESLDTCAGFITSVPTVITSQGTWCLDRDLSTSASSGRAIEIMVNNVTIDCNHFKLGNLGAGTTTGAGGIVALERLNVTIRNCVIRGFEQAIHLGNTGGGGHRVEDNRIEGATMLGIYVNGEVGSLVQRNVVTDIGGVPLSNLVKGIDAAGDVIDNVVEGVSPAVAPDDSFVAGIFVNTTIPGIVVRGNRVRDVHASVGTPAAGLFLQATGGVVRENVVVNTVPTTGTGVGCANWVMAADNVSEGFSSPYVGCTDGGGNITF